MEIVKLKPAVKDYIWGGTKLKGLGKEAPFSNIAECWELSFNDAGPSIIDSGVHKGQALKDVATPTDLGVNVSKFPFFPVLIKLIDSASNLSVQVHPSDEYALKNEGQLGKTEMWYVIESEPGAGLYLGFNKDTDPIEVRSRIEDGTIMDILNFYEVKPGEVYFIPSGTIHAIGKGVTVIEIQQNSTLTYRLYDYKRKDKDGHERELHVDKALKVLNFKAFKKKEVVRPLIGKSDYFASYEFEVKGHEVVKAKDDSFASITFIEGEGTFASVPYKKGDTFFIPCSKEGKIEGTGKYILTEVEK